MLLVSIPIYICYRVIKFTIKTTYKISINTFRILYKKYYDSSKLLTLGNNIFYNKLLSLDDKYN